MSNPIVSHYLWYGQSPVTKRRKKAEALFNKYGGIGPWNFLYVIISPCFRYSPSSLVLQ
jgi:hypothetical protein